MLSIQWIPFHKLLAYSPCTFSPLFQSCIFSFRSRELGTCVVLTFSPENSIYQLSHQKPGGSTDILYLRSALIPCTVLFLRSVIKIYPKNTIRVHYFHCNIVMYCTTCNMYIYTVSIILNVCDRNGRSDQPS